MWELRLALALALAAFVGCVGPAPTPLSGDNDSETTTPTKKKSSTSSGASTDQNPTDPPPSKGKTTKAPAQTGPSSGGGGSACIQAASSSGDGHHHAGEDCMHCHSDMAGATWTVAGTLYDASGSAVGGATIEVVDASGNTVQLVSGDNGNFFTDQQLTGPFHVRASQCPSNQQMVSTASNGSCNASGCHSSDNRIHL
jgi:hypothetical protein